jgi:hypothetical protein
MAVDKKGKGIRPTHADAAAGSHGRSTADDRLCPLTSVLSGGSLSVALRSLLIGLRRVRALKLLR